MGVVGSEEANASIILVEFVHRQPQGHVHGLLSCHGKLYDLMERLPFCISYPPIKVKEQVILRSLQLWWDCGNLNL